MLEIWQSLPDTYKYTDPFQSVHVWRADKIGKSATGMTCTYDGNPETAVLEAADAGEDTVLDIIINQVARAKNSPIISASNDIRLAQYFARESGETLYGLTLPAHRILRSPLRLSDTGWVDTGVEKTEELFIIGNISADEITSVKLNNDDPNASERLIASPPRRFRKPYTYEANIMSEFDGIPIPRQPNPAGIWKTVVNAC